jgi:hypothetical protein
MGIALTDNNTNENNKNHEQETTYFSNAFRYVWRSCESPE